MKNFRDKSKQQTATLTISINPTLLAALEEVCAREGKSRSEVVREAIMSKVGQ